MNNIYFRTPEGKRAVSFTVPVRTVRVTPPARINTNFTDGGRVGAGFIHERNDCGVRALAILKGWTYAQAHEFWANHGRKPGKGVRWALHCKHAGVERIDEIKGGSVAKVLAALPKTGRFVIRVPGHVFAVVDGVPHDTHRPKARGHVRGVYRNISFDSPPAMTEQERIELEAEHDGCRNELQRAFEVSRLTTPRRNVSAEVAKLVAAGHFVVVESWPSYCKSTDAILGESSRIAAIFQTYERAFEWASQQVQDENSFLVYPLVPALAPVQTVPENDIPF